VNVKLVPIRELNWRSTLKVKPAPKQLRFVADYEPVSLVILAKAYVRCGGAEWHPFAISFSDNVVGVVALAATENRCEIFHLLVDKKWQRKGIGRAAVELLVEHVEQNILDCDVITLTVHPENKNARKLYESCGFSDTGEVRDSEPLLALNTRKNNSIE